MATQQLGELGLSESEPVLIAWRWYYNVPSLALWILLLLATAVPKHNRRPQAWLILLLPLTVAAFFGLFQLLLSGQSGFAEFGLFVTALAIAWTCVWLLGGWLGSGRPFRAALVALGVMLGVGLVGYCGYFGFWWSSDVTWPMLGLWAVASVPLVANMLLTGMSCRGRCSPRQLLFWPMLWLPVASVVSVVVFVVTISLLQIGEGFSGIELLLTYLLPTVVISPFFATALYILNLPVLLLCISTPCYRERFASAFGQPSWDVPPGHQGNSPFLDRVHNALPLEESVLSGSTDTNAELK